MELEHRLEIDRKSRDPINVQLSRQLAWLISGGRLVAGDRLPAVRRLAAALGINLHTVRSAYRQLEEDGLVVTRHGSGTFVLPRDPGRRAHRGSGVPASTFGIVVPAHTDLYRRIIDGAESIAHDAPALLFVGNAMESEGMGLQIVERMIGRGVDGIILAAPMVPEAVGLELAETFRRIVFCDWPGGPRPRLLFDLEGGVAEAARHLAGHGHEKLGLIVPPPHWVNAEPIHSGYHRALSKIGLPSDTIVTVYNYTVEAGRRAAEILLSLPEPPTGVIASDDAYAIGFTQVLRERGMSVPDDAAIVGMGGHEIGAAVSPGLTTVDLPGTRMGREAMRILLEAPRGQAGESPEVKLECDLVVRESCGCP